MKTRNRPLWIVAAGAVVAIAAGLYLFYVQFGWGEYARSDYVGSWHMDGPDGRGSKLVLGPDGSVKIENAPRVVFALGGYSDPDWKHTLDLTGLWDIANSRTIFVNTRLGGVKLWAQGHGWGMTLNLVAGGDPDNSPTFTFRRQ